MLVNTLSHVGRLLRSLGSFALIGLLVLLVGPAVLALVTAFLSAFVALTSVLLPLAIVGLIVWLPYKLVTAGPQPTWERTCELAKGLKDSTVTAPLNFCGGAWTKACDLGRGVRDFNRQALHFLGVFLLEALSGAVAGFLVALFTVAGTPDDPAIFLLICTAAGAGIGGLIAIARFKSSEPG